MIIQMLDKFCHINAIDILPQEIECYNKQENISCPSM